MALEILGGDPDAAAEYAELLHEFLENTTELIARTLGVEDIDSFVDAVMEEVDT